MDKKLIFDAHTHFHDQKYEKENLSIDDLVFEAERNGVGYFCDTAYDLESSTKCIETAKKYNNVYATVGIHPNEVDKYNDMDLEKIKKLANNKKVVAIGEVGLDYYYSKESIDKQKVYFKKQIKIAIENNLTLMMHIRDQKNVYKAYDDVLDILKRFPIKNMIVHCFSANKEYALKFLNIGCFINIGGAVTFNNAKDLQEAVNVIPLNKILVETDAPYLTPHPFRGQTNRPKYINLTIDKIAEIKNVSREKVIESTTQNAFDVFQLNE